MFIQNQQLLRAHICFLLFPRYCECSTEICVTKYSILSYALNKHAIIDYFIFYVTFRCTVHRPFHGLVFEQCFYNSDAEQYVPFCGAPFIAVKREEGWVFLLVHELWKSLNKMIGQEHWFLTDAVVRFCFQEAKCLRVLCWINHPELGGYLYTIYSTTPSYSDRQGAAAMDQRLTVWGTVQL